MEEIKNLFVKHFGFFPEVISTTEHAYISPPSRVISSLVELSKHQKVLRFVITDKYAIHPESSTQQICLPYILNKKLFNIRNGPSKIELVKKFEESFIQVEDILKSQFIFSQQEIVNYIELTIIYRNILENIKSIDPVLVYNDIIREYINILKLPYLHRWVERTKLFDLDSIKVRSFIKEALYILHNIDPIGLNLFGKYLEKNKRLKYKIDDINQVVSWSKYLEELDNTLNGCSIPFEVILYIYSYCGGSHFGNDYGMVDDINKIRKDNNLSQITEHNRDYSFKVELKGVQFKKVINNDGKWSLSNKVYKNVDSLSELYILLGKEELIQLFKN